MLGIKLLEIYVTKFIAGHAIVDLTMCKGGDRVYATTDQELSEVRSICRIEHGSFSPVSADTETEIKDFIKTLDPFKVLNNQCEGVAFKDRNHN